MWFGVLISCIILMGDVFAKHCKSVVVDLKKCNFTSEWLFNAPWHISWVAYWKWKNLSLNSTAFFLTKSDRISLETSWFLKFEFWCVSHRINWNFFRCLNQVSHRNNQPLPFFNFLTWYEVWYLSSDILISLHGYLWISLW